MLIVLNTHKCFDDIAIYLISLVSLALTGEIYVTGKASKYGLDHVASMDGKAIGKRLTFYPSTVLDPFYKQKWPSQLRFDVKPVTIPANQNLPLGVFEKPLYAIGQSMFINYFERYRPTIGNTYGAKKPYKWPAEWNFARVVRNAISHNGMINFESQSSKPVSWKGLVYDPKDNGKRIIFTDLWMADLIYLMLEMDSYL